MALLLKYPLITSRPPALRPSHRVLQMQRDPHFDLPPGLYRGGACHAASALVEFGRGTGV